MAISIVEKIINSFRYTLENISDLDCYIYTDSKVDLDEVLTARAKVNLPLGTETTFVAQLNIEGAWYDAIGTQQIYNLLKRYVKITLPSNGSVKYILIDSYNVATGLITLSEAFGEAIATTNTFEIVVVDSIFFKEDIVIDRGMSSKFNKKFLRIYMDIKTKEDSNRSKNRLFQELISAKVGQYNNMQILDTNLVTVLGNVAFEDNGTFRETVDSSDQLIVYVGNIPLNYYINNFG